MPDWSAPHLVGTLVTLRRYQPDDAAALWEMVNEPEGAMLTATTDTFTKPQIEEWVLKVAHAQDRLDLVVVENATGEYAGEVVFNAYVPEQASVNFRIALRGPAWWGRGLGSEATELMCEYGFSHLALRRITLDVLATNVRARRVYEKSGFRVVREYTEDSLEWVHMQRKRDSA